MECLYGKLTRKSAQPVHPLTTTSRFRILRPAFPRTRTETVGYPSGQRGQTVNLLAYAFAGSNPAPTTILFEFRMKMSKFKSVASFSGLNELLHVFAQQISFKTHGISDFAFAQRGCFERVWNDPKAKATFVHLRDSEADTIHGN
jgi:hypothetical protein